MNIIQETTALQTGQELFIKMVISNWELQNQRVNGLLGKLDEQQMLQQVAPGKNRAAYLLGHLTAVNDGMLPLLGLGERQFPELELLYVKNPDDALAQTPSIAELTAAWNSVNQTLTQHFNQMQPADWFTKHSAISEQDFLKEPHRNKLNILINRTNHQSYHLGQLIFLKP